MSRNKPYLLVVEDDKGIQNQLKWSFDDYSVEIAGDRDSAIALIRKYEPAVVLLDLGLPPDPGGSSEGLRATEEIMAISPFTKIIVVTGNDQHENAVSAIGKGAYDFYQKPIDIDDIKLVVARASKLHALEVENSRLRRSVGVSPLTGLIASSPQMLDICRKVEKVAPMDVSTLLLGESGTGKEVLAKALHALSPRAEKPMVAINCAAIPGELLESELFGHEKGSFTGATRQSIGKIELANGGTLFLDEIGDMPEKLQGKLLRFLQERVIERVGGRTEIPIDVRVLTATHRSINTLIEENRFREDLYYRIAEVTLTIPALREREGDIILLSNAFLERFSEQLSTPLKRFSVDSLAALTQHDWPGNIRELENRIKRAVILSSGKMITPTDLELDTIVDHAAPLNLKEVRNNAERQAIINALAQTENNISNCAKLLGITRPTLYDLINKHQLDDKKN